MSRAVRFHPAARAEFVEAAAWYESQKQGLGAEFVAEIEHGVHDAATNPEAFPVIHLDLRRAIARRFPYCVYFREESECIRVIAVFHASRDPTIWRSRL